MPTTKTLGCLPFFAKGIVVKGFGRGSKELGIPTGKSKMHALILSFKYYLG